MRVSEVLANASLGDFVTTLNVEHPWDRLDKVYHQAKIRLVTLRLSSLNTHESTQGLTDALKYFAKSPIAPNYTTSLSKLLTRLPISKPYPIRRGRRRLINITCIPALLQHA